MVYKGFISMIVFWLSFGFFCYASESDSLGVETRDNQIFVLHQVESQETLYSLSKRYGSSVADIVEHNQISDNNLTIGAVLKIPWSGSVIHRVSTGETLYSISRAYNVSVSDLKKLNNLNDDDLEIGQEITILGTSSVSVPGPEVPPPLVDSDRAIHVVSPKETLYSISQKYGFSVEQLRRWNGMESNDVQIGDTILLKPVPNVQEANESEQTSLKPQSTAMITTEAKPVSTSFTTQSDLAPITETGVAAVIDGSTDTKKYLALHPTAPVGTIMRVRNEMTNLSVFVRVVGKLPATGTNNNVLIRLSEAAQTALGALDEKFRVELSYVPNR